MPAIANPLDLTGKTILVTGASSGIGRDACVLLSELGARVILASRRMDSLNETLGQMHGDVHAIRTFDFSHTRSILSWLKSVAADVGPLDGIIHSAGVTNTEAIRHLDYEKMDHMIDLNLKSGLALVHASRNKQIRRQGSAMSIVFISSTAAHTGHVGLAVYSATKGGIEAATRTLAVELAKENIRINTVAPGLVETEMVTSFRDNLAGSEAFKKGTDTHPLGLGKPRDVSNAIAFLLSDASRWITGTSLVVDGGRLA